VVAIVFGAVVLGFNPNRWDVVIPESNCPPSRGRKEDVVRRESNNHQMDTVTPRLAETRLSASRRYDLNWGLIGALGLCMLFWAAATFGLILAL